MLDALIAERTRLEDEMSRTSGKEVSIQTKINDVDEKLATFGITKPTGK